MGRKIDRLKTHIAHCCVLHGCKYPHDGSCPVVTRVAVQDFLCEQCDSNGIDRIPNPDDPNYDLYSMDPVELRALVRDLRTQAKDAARELRQLALDLRALFKEKPDDRSDESAASNQREG